MCAARFENWSGSVKCSPAEIAKPGDIEGVRRVLADAARNGRKVRMVGTGHSFTPLVATDGVILSLDNLQGVESVDLAKGEAVVWAGTKLWRLNELLWERGAAMENLGDINKQSLAGALGTGTHGTGSGFGVIANQVRGLTIMTAAGELIETSPTENADLFKAAQVSLGSLGVVLKARLGVVPAYNLRYVRRRTTLNETEANLAEYKKTQHFEFYWFPYTEAVQLKFLDETKEPAQPKPVKKFISDVLLENLTFGTLCRISRAFPSFCETSCKLCGRFLSDNEEVNQGHRVFSTQRLVRFNELEYGVPAAEGMATLRDIKAWIAKERIRVNFPLEFRFVKGDDLWLSPGHGRETVFISVHMYQGMPHKEYFEGVEKIFRAHNGRPHWGKMHTLAAAELAPLYPHWDDFQNARRRLDPTGMFATPYLERVLGPIGAPAAAGAGTGARA